jgi:undecaprenyl-diphosphatase
MRVKGDALYTVRMSFVQVVVLALIQGLAELLPVSSSAHVVVFEKLMGLDPTAPQMTLLLVMLHTGTMLSVIVYFWRAWKETYFASATAFNRFLARLLWATLLTGLLGEALRKFLEHALFRGAKSTDIEQLFGRLDLIAPALAAAGVLILVSGLLEARRRNELPLTVSSEALAESTRATSGTVTVGQATWMGLVQGLALPFRGFSRSGSTISTGMLAGAPRQKAERFSFALAVVLTPVVVAMEGLRLEKASRAAVSAGTYVSLRGSLGLSAVGMVFSFLAGLAALKWLSSWLEQGRWHLFGIYCLVASAGVWYLHFVRGF